MIYTPEQVKVMTVEELDQAIANLKNLLTQMVGSLYPNIVRSEIIDLQDLRDGIIYERNSFNSRTT